MGLESSKIILGRLSSACLRADYRGRFDILEVLSDDEEFMRQLQELWKQLPTSSKKTIKKSNRRSRRRSSAAPKTLPETVLKFRQKWHDDPQSFFIGEDRIEIDLNHPIAASYNLLSALEEREEKDVWRSRFLMVIFHRLLQRICRLTVLSKDIERASIIIKRSGIVSESSDNIRSRLDNWRIIGRKIDSLCEELAEPQECGREDEVRGDHLGFLFRLPGDMSDSRIKTLPLSGDRRSGELERLKRSGLVASQDQKKTNDMASKIFNFLWQLIEESIRQEDFMSYEAPNAPEAVRLSTHDHRQDSTRPLPLPEQRVDPIAQAEMESVNPHIPSTASLASGPNQLIQQSGRPAMDPNNQTEHTQMDASANNFDPRPYLTHIPAPTSQQFEMQQLDMAAAAHANCQTEHTQMDASANNFDPRPYLTYIPAPTPQQFEMQQPEMAAAAHANSQTEHTQMDASTNNFNPRPYLTYIPAPTSQQFEIQQLNMEAVHSSDEFGQTHMSFLSNHFDPRPYLSYISTSASHLFENQQSSLAGHLNNEVESTPLDASPDNLDQRPPYTLAHQGVEKNNQPHLAAYSSNDSCSQRNENQEMPAFFQVHQSNPSLMPSEFEIDGHHREMNGIQDLHILHAIAGPNGFDNVNQSDSYNQSVRMAA